MEQPLGIGMSVYCNIVAEVVRI